MPAVASTGNLEVDPQALGILTTACDVVFNESVRLATRLERDEEVHIAEIHGRADRIFKKLDKQIAEEPAAQEVWVHLRQVLRDLIEHVILNSTWANGLTCSHCKANLNLSRLPPGFIEEIARGLDDPNQSAVVLVLLALRNREPHALYTGHWGDLAQKLLSDSQPTISEEAFPNTGPCPQLPAPLVQSSVTIEPLNSDVAPVGLAGEAWNALEAFYQEHRITWKGLQLDLLLGETGSGKTELVRASALPFAPVNGEPRKNLNFTWWYAAKKGVILETPGGFTSENANESESAQWQHMLKLLSTRSPRPIDSLTLTVDLSVILKNESTADELAERLRALLQQVSRGLGIRFPVYLILTHGETLFGFTEFARTLDADQRRQSMAWIPTAKLTASLDPETAREGIDKMVQHQRDLLPHLLVRAGDRMEASAIYAFPQEFDLLKKPLSNFLERLFTAFGSTPLYYFRGFWLTSARPSGKPVQRALAYTPPSEETYKALPAVWVEEPLFCDDLYESRIFAERNLVAMGPRENRRGSGAGSFSVRNILGRIWQFIKNLTGWRRDVFFVILLALFIWLAVEAYRLFSVLEETRILKKEPLLAMHFTLLPAGEFIMGSPTSDLYRDEDETPHWREIPQPFYIATHEVTQAQWFEIMGANPSNFKDPDYPVDSVSWTDCIEFIDKLNLHTRDGHYALPSEKQWEYAAKAGSQESLPASAEDRAWFAINSKQRTHPVGFKAPGEWGLYDMYGNVSEWVQDWYSFDYIPIQDPYGPEVGTQKVNRGGAFFDQLPTLRASRRIAANPDDRLPWVGLRLIWVPDPQSKKGAYIQMHPKRISMFYASRTWLRNNSDLVGSVLGDVGGWVSDNWDDLWTFILGEDAQAPPKEAVDAAADAVGEALKTQ